VCDHNCCICLHAASASADFAARNSLQQYPTDEPDSRWGPHLNWYPEVTAAQVKPHRYAQQRLTPCCLSPADTAARPARAETLTIRHYSSLAKYTNADNYHTIAMKELSALALKIIHQLLLPLLMPLQTTIFCWPLCRCPTAATPQHGPGLGCKLPLCRPSPTT
jgi:hypothetical protein